MLKNVSFFIFFICCTQIVFAQEKSVSNDSAEVTFIKVDEEAYFPGGVEGWKSFLRKKLSADIPVRNNAPDGFYTVVVRFIVSKDGSIKDLTPETSHGYGMEKEVIRVLKKGPRWMPAKQNGNIVNAYKRQPVTFVVSTEYKSSRN